MAGIRKRLWRDHEFYYSSQNAGKDVKDNVKCLEVKNPNERIETLIKREEIEAKIKNHSTRYF